MNYKNIVKYTKEIIKQRFWHALKTINVHCHIIWSDRVVCLPESICPLSPTIVSNPLGKDLMKLRALAFLAASSIWVGLTLFMSGAP